MNGVPTGGQPSIRHPVLIACALALGVAISLGMARFSFGLLLPVMREDLQWSYTLAGGLNTANAMGYLVGALLAPWMIRRWGSQATLNGGAALTSLWMVVSGFSIDATVLMLLRLLAGMSSAMVFVSGGLLAARLGQSAPQKSGLLLGIYYGGAGLGIVLSCVAVPWSLTFAQTLERPHAWQPAWIWLGFLCALCSVALWAGARSLGNSPAAPVGEIRVSAWHLRYGLAGYFMFGVGYIGYMTFIIALLREQSVPASQITGFYIALGVACMASSRLWARMLDRFRGGQSLAILNGLLGIAALTPLISLQLPVLLASGIAFGAVFLSVVASTTAMVKHNLPPSQWARGIGFFTIVFAVGQVIGPTLTGFISDSPAGLAGGLQFSGAALLLGSIIAIRQKPL